MYLFPLGFCTIAVDRRAEQNRLREEMRVEFMVKKRLAEEKAEFLRFKEAAKKEFLKKERKRLDPGYDPDNELSEITQKTLAELKGEKGSFGNYSRFIEGRELDDRDRHDVARSMALAEVGFGLLDLISANQLMAVFSKFSPGPGELVFTVNGQNYSWTKLRKGPLANYFLPGRQRLSENGTSAVRGDLNLEHGSLLLRLSVLKSGGLQWSLRGASLLKPSHRKVLQGLNWVLEDYRDRLEWLKVYRSGVFVPGYSEEDIRQIQDSIDHFNGSVLPRMDWLKPGIFIPGEYTSLSMKATRIYPIRCTICERVTRVESFWPQGHTAVNWQKGKGIYHTNSIEMSPNRILSSLHRSTGCTGENGINARNGNLVSY